jgi:signal transduction histidine kinase
MDVITGEKADRTTVRARPSAVRGGHTRMHGMPGPALALALGCVPCGFLIGLAIFQLAVGGPRLAQTRALVDRSYEVLNTAGRLIQAVQDAERGERGYLLTGDEAYLRPYANALAAEPGLVAQLHALVAADDGQQQRRLADAEVPLGAKMDELARSLDAYRAGGSEAALAVLRTGDGLRAMREFLTAMRTFVAEENALLTRRLDEADTAERRTIFSTVAGSLLAVAALAVSLLVLYRALDRVRRSRITLRTTLDTVPAGVAAVDADGALMAWNDNFLRNDEIVVADLRTAVARFAAMAERGRRTGRAQPSEEIRPSGRTVEFCVNPIEDGGYVVISTDVTERRQSEAFYAQARKMQAVGQMTGGVAHDFNNLLTVVMGSLERLQTAVGDDPAIRRHVQLAMMASERGAKLNRQLLAFARRQPLEPTVLNPASAIAEMMDLVRRTAGEPVEVEVIRAAGMWNTQADRAQFESAVLNLAINARDAMPHGGKLTIETANASLDQAYADRHAEVQAGQYVMLAVTDTGIGMTPEVAARAFDPFFTTKPMGQGSGLGLSQIYGFVKQSGGHIKIYSEPGHGTTVKLYLPRSTEAEDAGPAAPGEAIHGDETVLVVEDDADVRATVIGLLRDLGYRVLEAASGAQALTILESGEPIDLLFTDVVMTGSVTGKVLAQTARELRPGIKVLFTSGYTENSIIHQGRLDAGVQLLSKPYRRDELAARLRTVLTS